MSALVQENPDHAWLSDLARKDPDAFEEARRGLIDQLIRQAPDRMRRRLEGLQFRLDVIHQRAANPLAASVKVYEMMWQSFMRLNAELNQSHPVPGDNPPERVARIIPFRPREGPKGEEI